jgi:hypothetical protein
VAYSLEFVVGTVYLENDVDVVGAGMAALEDPVLEIYQVVHRVGSFFHHHLHFGEIFDHYCNAFFEEAVVEGLLLETVHSLLNS